MCLFFEPKNGQIINKIAISSSHFAIYSCPPQLEFTDCDQKNEFLWPFFKNIPKKECLYLWHLCIPWSYAQKIQIIPAPKKKKSLSIYWKKNARVTLYYWKMMGILHWMYFLMYFSLCFAYLRFNDIGKVDHLHFCNFFSYHIFSLFALFFSF